MVDRDICCAALFIGAKHSHFVDSLFGDNNGENLELPAHELEVVATHLEQRGLLAATGEARLGRNVLQVADRDSSREHLEH